MLHDPVTQATLIFFEDGALDLRHETHNFSKNQNGRIVIPEELKQGRSIIAVCDGQVDILNSIGDRIVPFEGVA
ncbi:TIGR02922 family protein [Psychrosphaera aestuarii]|uniref:TIGR02922 family protein n=1 Tax=Psychrosphaera aestuarii TaxID=1266052 RepID=UPI001B33C151|nr:TIGR02922 family protein [Psychrosphaera aestuarii]